MSRDLPAVAIDGALHRRVKGVWQRKEPGGPWMPAKGQEQLEARWLAKQRGLRSYVG
jgi:hypothetical protein